MAQTPQDIRRGLLHAELAGNILANKREAIRLRAAVMQVEAVVKMLQPGFNVASIAAKRHNKSNPWFKRGGCSRARWTCCRGADAEYGAGDCGDADSWQGPRGLPGAVQRPTGGYPGCASEAQWQDGDWRGRPS